MEGERVIRYAVRDGWREVCEKAFSQWMEGEGKGKGIRLENHSHYAYAGKRAFFDGAAFGSFQLLSPTTPLLQYADISPIFSHLESKVELAKYMQREGKEELIPHSLTFTWDVDIRAPSIVKKLTKKIKDEGGCVLKYDGSSSGVDVHFLSSFDEVARMVEENREMQQQLPFLSSRSSSINGWSMQSFIRSPLLISKKKFHLRVYTVMVRGRIYYYRTAEVRLAESEYTEDMKDRKAQISNGRGGLHDRRLLAHNLPSLSPYLSLLPSFLSSLMLPFSITRNLLKRQQVGWMQDEGVEEDWRKRNREMDEMWEKNGEEGMEEMVGRVAMNEMVMERKKYIASMEGGEEEGRWREYSFVAHDIMLGADGQLLLLETNHCPSSPPPSLAGEFGDHLQHLILNLFNVVLFGDDDVFLPPPCFFDPLLPPLNRFHYLGSVSL